MKDLFRHDALATFLVVMVALEGLTRYGTQAAFGSGTESPPQRQEIVAGLTSPVAQGAENEAASQPPLALVLAPVDVATVPGAASGVSARVGQVFALQVRVQNPASHPLDAVAAHFDFDPSLLEVVDAVGAPAQRLVPGNDLAMVLQNQVDQARGTVDFAAGRGLTDASPNGSLTLATVYFKTKAVNQGSPIGFSRGVRVPTVPGSFTNIRRSEAAYRGELVPLSLAGTVVTVIPAP